MTGSSARDVAGALRRHSLQAATEEPAVRGADWQTATVATVGTDGTVTTTDGITARRLVGYDLPAVGDRIAITQSSIGNWLAQDRTAPATLDGWQTPTLTAPWGPYTGANGYRQIRYRRSGNEVIIEGLTSSDPTSVSGTSNVFTLPTGFRPTGSYAWATMANAGVRQLNVFSTGIVALTGLPAGIVTFVSLNCRFSLI